MNQDSKRFCSRVYAARIVLAAMLLLGLLSTNLPFAAIAGASTCTLSCCAGMLPHAAGSCMGGSCHVDILGHGKATHSVLTSPAQEPEKLCGLPRHLSATDLTLQSSVRTVDADTETADGLSPESQIGSRLARAAALVKPCQPECGSGATGFTNSNAKRNPGTVAHCGHPRLSSNIRYVDESRQQARNLTALARRGTTRGPPQSFS